MLPDNSMLHPLRRDRGSSPMGMGEDGRRSGEGRQGETKPNGADTGEGSQSNSMPAAALLAGLPGEALVREGLADCQAGRGTIAACLIGIAGPRLTRAGLISAAGISALREPEFQLYRLLRQQGSDAYSRYNALLRELVSFESALDLRCRH